MKRSNFCNIPELKLMVILLHYILLQIISFVYFTQSQIVTNELINSITVYFICEMNGPDSTCSRKEFENLLNPGLSALSIILAMLVPVSSLVFVIDFWELKNCLTSFLNRIIKGNKIINQGRHDTAMKDIPKIMS